MYQDTIYTIANLWFFLEFIIDKAESVEIIAMIVMPKGISMYIHYIAILY